MLKILVVIILGIFNFVTKRFIRLDKKFELKFFSRKYDTIEKNIIQKNITHMSKKIIHGDEARRALAKGMDILVEAVAVTIGPRGRNVVIDNAYGSPQIINDGVTIAKEIELKDNAANTGVGLIKQAALKTNDVAGDGTTTATILA